MADEIERRIYTGVEIRAEGEDTPKIGGYAAMFNSMSENLGGFREIIRPGAFRGTLNDDVRALINHEPGQILGRTTAGTLRLEEDEAGLRYEIDPPETQYARDLMASLKRGDVNQSSFGFQVQEESWIEPGVEDSLPVRVLHRVKLFDVSPVTFPAYPATSVAVRAVERAVEFAVSGGAIGAAADQESAAGRLAIRRRKLDLIEN